MKFYYANNQASFPEIYSVFLGIERKPVFLKQ